MKSAFGSKRKARKIQVDEDEDEPMTTENTTSHITERPKVVTRKPFKKSHLRKSLAFEEEPSESAQEGSLADDEQSSKCTLSRPASTVIKPKKKGASRLSFGPGEIVSGDAAEALEDEEAFKPKKSAFSRRVIESNALRKTLPGVHNLSIRSTDDDDERPTYSKDYLNELKNSTPSAPKDTQSYVEDDEETGLDESELEGATIVAIPSQPAYIPSTAEILEKKQRRARLAQEQDFISFSETENSHQISLLPTRKKTETRLVREDEDLAEGFDEFVDDGRISLGKKAEREAKRKLKKKMAAMIMEAEGGEDDDESDDSEAERIAAYEAAQTRAGMDGLAANKANNHPSSSSSSHLTSQIPPKISPLPVLSECLERLQNTLNRMEQALGQSKNKMEGLDEEKVKIERREGEVQRLLKEAGERYSALRADVRVPVGAVDPKDMLDESSSALRFESKVGSRGLESFGNTPVVNREVEDVG